jgi:hypothetical protein
MDKYFQKLFLLAMLGLILILSPDASPALTAESGALPMAAQIPFSPPGILILANQTVPQGRAQYGEIFGTYDFKNDTLSAQAVVSSAPDGRINLNYTAKAAIFTCQMTAAARQNEAQQALAAEMPVPFQTEDKFGLKVTFYSNGLIIKRETDQSDESDSGQFFCGTGAAFLTNILFQKQ